MLKQINATTYIQTHQKRYKIPRYNLLATEYTVKIVQKSNT